MTDLQLISLKNVSLLEFEEFKRKTTKVEREQFMEDKEYHKTLQHLQAQLERAHQQKKNLDLADIKKRLKDYEQMLEYCALMRMKNKMKDSKAKSKECWEVVDKYFTKELENNLA